MVGCIAYPLHLNTFYIAGLIPSLKRGWYNLPDWYIYHLATFLIVLRIFFIMYINLKLILAGIIGLEPMTSRLTVLRSNLLN